MATGERVGEVAHFYDRLSVAVIKASKGLRLGEQVHFLGKGTDFQQTITSMQIEHQAVTEVAAGGEVAIQVKQKVHPGDAVFRLSGEG